MDIWSWVIRAVDEARKAGRHRLAELILRVPQLAADDEHAQLDAVFPEALALAREAKNPWLEIYFRHWNLQSRVLHRLEVGGWMGEAARLLDFAHSDEGRSCPQSVCVTQDFASCFGNLDGPAYVQERLAAAQETLDRINPRWPCFTCISTEYAGALADAGRLEESLTFLDRQEAALVAAGEGGQRDRFISARAEALMDLGRFGEALALLDTAGEPHDENKRLENAIERARALAGLGRPEEASAVLPALEAIRPTPSLYGRWVEAHAMLVGAGARPNDWALDRELLGLEETLTGNGVARKAFELARERARLAVQRGARASALHACARMEALLPRLRKPLGADERLAAMRAAALALGEPAVAPAGSPEEVMTACEDEDPESALDALRAARARWPEHEGLALREADALRALGRSGEAEALLRAHLERAPDALEALRKLAGVFLEGRRLDALRELAQGLLARAPGDEAKTLARWFLARVAEQEERLEEAKAHLRELLALAPQDYPATLKLAALERDSGEGEAALARLDAALARWPEPGPHDWERMIAATLLDRWETVRDSAARLGIALSGEGPVDENWSLCRVRLVEVNGEASELYAERTGPVSARILSIALPGNPQHSGDEVVLAVPALEDPPPEGEEGPPPLYRAVAVKRPGGHRVFALDGVHPGEDAVAELREALRALGARLTVRSDERYFLQSPDEEEVALPGLYALVAAPPEVELARVEQLLSTAATAWEHPLVWTGLLELLGRREALEVQWAVMERYGIKP